MESPVYSLCGIVSHIGAKLGRGHYVYDGITNDGSWTCFNDSQVTTGLSAQHLARSRSAYLLLFKKND